jgi:DNA-binding beta-propeller fold protein YncE
MFKRLVLMCFLASSWMLTNCQVDSLVVDGHASEEQPTSPPGTTPSSSQCLVGTDCASGVCESGVCALTGPVACPDPGPCGNCQLDCSRDFAGPGTANPFTLDETAEPIETSRGVVLDDTGGVTIGIETFESHFIWVANTGDGTISKVDTRTHQEVARYLTGPDGRRNDPSRTSVDEMGHVFVGNREGQTVTKISSDGTSCPDRNGDGTVRTSSGPSDVLPWMEDECILWNVRVAGGGLIRAVAAQPAQVFDDDVRQDIPASVWIGGWQGTVWKLDSATGQTVIETQSPVNNYGFALDRKGNLWISGSSSIPKIGRIDTHQCIDNMSCNVAACTNEGDDTCVKQTISLPNGLVPYGITVDYKQRVWFGGNSISRYDASLAVGARFTSIQAVAFVHGIAADNKGWVWGAGMRAGVVRANGDDPTQHTIVAETVGLSSKGMAVDLDGNIWAINQSHSTATVITPGAALQDHSVIQHAASGFVAPYTYSDMTGTQLRFATNPTGTYQRVFEGCPESPDIPETLWDELRWEVDTPTGTSATFSVRTTATVAELSAETWMEVAEVPSSTSPYDMATPLEAAGMQGARIIEVKVQLKTGRDAQDNVTAPTLRRLEVTRLCPRVLR